MATTTNYSWTTPDDTGLVKDGASAIRSLGTAIDTTVFNNASAAVPKTIIDAKGDLIVGSAADTAVRFAVGTNGQVLKADSTTSTGLAWGSSAGGLTYITTSSFSSSSAVNFNDVFSSTYDNYKIMVYLDSATAGSDIYMRMRVSGSDNSTAGDYFYGSTNTGIDRTGTTGGDWAGSSQTGFSITNGVIDSSRRTCSSVELFSPYRTAIAEFVSIGIDGNGYPANYTAFRGGRMNVTTSYTGFSLVPSSGNITGKAVVYGYYQ